MRFCVKPENFLAIAYNYLKAFVQRHSPKALQNNFRKLPSQEAMRKHQHKVLSKDIACKATSMQSFYANAILARKHQLKVAHQKQCRQENNNAKQL